MLELSHLLYNLVQQKQNKRPFFNVYTMVVISYVVYWSCIISDLAAQVITMTSQWMM